MKIMTNVIGKEKLREVQSETLRVLADCLKPSFGPMGSNTIISGGGKRLTQYTKDGKTILNRIQLFGDIEETVKQDIFEITRSVVKNVGDGTTSAIILSHLIFEELKNFETDLTPFQLMREFHNAVSDITIAIRSRAKQLDIDGVYDIALVSTNGNTRFAECIRDIYKRYGMGVFIDVAVSTNGKTFIKEYNGMNLECGFMDSSFVNNAKNLCIVKKPRIYAFIDPINTLEQAKFLDKIIHDNIMMGLTSQDASLIKPTVILAPSISRDMSMYIDQLIGMLNQCDHSQRLPFCIITNITQPEQYQDLIKLLGCKPIQKYIDPKVYNEMVEKGIAPTFDTISENFYGTCEEAVIDAEKSKFINPAFLRDVNGEYTNVFKNHLSFLEAELKKQQDQGASPHEVGNLKRRIQSLKANLVELHIGGITAADRDSVRDLVEDAVLNIRSAANHGYGMASNIEGLIASQKIETKIGKVIFTAYTKLIDILYMNSFVEHPSAIINQILIKDGTIAYDVFNKEYSDKIISSIESDCAVLDGISKIVTLLFTSNQYLCANTADANMYRN